MTAYPRYSIVIPTRERADTLRWCLATCLAQRFDDCEILVSDNFSSPETRAVVESFSDPRLHYVRTQQALAMTDSWEFAVGQAAGEFITVVGDDDGLLLHAMPEIDRIITELDAKALRWESVRYCWPCLASRDVAEPNALLIPLSQVESRHRILRREGRAMVEMAARFETGYWHLPMIYNSMIHRSVLDRIRQRAGRMFQSRCPDVYSGYAIAANVDEYYSVEAPLGLCGLSGKSNGVSWIYCKEQSDVARDYTHLNAQAQIAWHPRAVELPTLSAASADSFLAVRDHFYTEESAPFIDYRRLIVDSFRELRVADETEWHAVRDTIRRGLSFDAHLSTWFDAEYGAMTFEQVRILRQPPVFRHYGGHYLNLDAAQFGVSNVLEAAELCEKLLGYRLEGVATRLELPPEPPAVVVEPEPLAIEMVKRRVDPPERPTPRASSLQRAKRRVKRMLHG